MLSNRGAVLRWVSGCVVLGLVFAGLFAPVAGGTGHTVDLTTGAMEQVALDVGSGAVPAASTVLDADGEPLTRIFDRYRVPADAGEISPWMNAAVVAIEDRRFYSHDGLDWVGTARALVENLAAHGDALRGQGASTITMQYVKNYRLQVLADTEAERAAAVADTVARKLTEARAARRLEQRLPKQEILRRYLNLVYFGNGAYGVTAAARTYFDTTAAALTIPQAALLAGLVRAPAALDPVQHPDAALARRNLVLRAMVDVGSLTSPTAAAARARPLGIERPLVSPRHGCAAARAGTGFFCRYAVAYLESAGLSREQLRTGGYTVRTTLDPRAGQAAKQAAQDQVPAGCTTGIANAVAVVQPGREQYRVLALAADLGYGPDESADHTRYPLPDHYVTKEFTAATIVSGGRWCPPDPIASVTDRYGKPVPLDESGRHRGASRTSGTPCSGSAPTRSYPAADPSTSCPSVRISAAASRG